MNRYGMRVAGAVPVTAVEGLGGDVMAVEGLWRFELETVYERVLVLEALVVSGYGEELLLGNDFAMPRRAVVNYETYALTYNEGGYRAEMPFDCDVIDSADATTAVVWLARKQKLNTESRVNVELAADSPEGMLGVFTPCAQRESYLLQAPTFTRVLNGRVCVPVLNVHSAG